MKGREPWVWGLVISLLLITGCGKTDGDLSAGTEEVLPDEQHTETVVIILRHDGQEGSLTDLAAKRLREWLEENSQGEIQLEIYAESQMGDQNDIAYALKYGTLTMYIGEPLYPTMKCISWTALSGDVETFESLAEQGPVYDLINEECRENGVLFLGTLSNQYYMMSSNRAIETAEDFSGLRMAVSSSDESAIFWRNLGVEVVESNPRQVFTAIQQSIVDAQESVLHDSLAGQISRYHPYMLLTEHRISSRAVYINRNAYQQMSTEQQTVLLEGVAEAEKWLRDDLSLQWETIQNDLVDAGVEVSPCSDELKTATNSLVFEPLIQELRIRYGDELLDRVLTFIH